MRSALRTVLKRWLMSTTARPSGELADVLEHVPLGLGVERAGGLVEHQDLRVAHEGAGERDLLPLADAQLLAVLEPLAEQRVVAVAQAADDLVGAGVAGGGLDGRVVSGASAQVDVAHADVLARRELVLGEVLEDHAHLAAQARRRRSCAGRRRRG